MSCPHSHMEEKYDPCGFSLQLSTDDQFHRTYFKPCWPHTGHRHHACWRYHTGMMEQSMNWKYHSVKNEIPRIRAKTALVLCFTWVRDGWGRTEMNDSQMYELILTSHMGSSSVPPEPAGSGDPPSTARSVPLFVRQKFKKHQSCDYTHCITQYLQHIIKKIILPSEESDVVSTYLYLSASLLYIHLYFCLIKSLRKKDKGMRSVTCSHGDWEELKRRMWYVI